MRGVRALSEDNELFFKYRAIADEETTMIVKLVNSQTNDEYAVRIRNLNKKEWDDVIIPFALKKRLPANRPYTVDEIHMLLENPGELLIDDLLLYERGE